MKGYINSIIIITFLMANSAFARSAFDEAAPEYNFFMDKFFYCEICETVTVIVSSPKKMNAQVIDSFQVMSEDLLGKKNAGSVLNKNEFMSYIKIFNDYKCGKSITEGYYDDFVVFIDVGEKDCSVFPYGNNNHLNHIIMIIAESIRTNANKKPDEIENLVRISIDSMMSKNEISSSFREPAMKLLSFIIQRIKEIQNNSSSE